MVKFGLQHPCYSFDGTGHDIFQTVLKRAKFAEENGFDSFWVMDHFFQIPGIGKAEEPMLEAWSAISGLASVTRTIKLGTLVTTSLYRNPAVLAKIGATVDVISNGRLIMGIGAGWFETEAKAYGIPFELAPNRVERLKETVQIIRGMWSENDFSFHGKHYTVEGALCFPKPVQRPCPPILIGGSGEKLTLRVVAKYGDACNLSGAPKTVRKRLELLKQYCRDAGTSYEAILKTMLGHVIIGKNEREVAEALAQHHRLGLTDAERDERAIYGTPNEVVEKVRRYVSEGIEYMIFNTDYSKEERMLSLLVTDVIPKLL